MTSSRVIFLALIFLVIIVLSSNKIADFLKNRFGRYFPTPSAVSVQESNVIVTPTPTQTNGFPVSPTLEYKSDNEKATEIPKTGPSEIMLVVIGGSLVAGTVIKTVSKKLL